MSPPIVAAALVRARRDRPHGADHTDAPGVRRGHGSAEPGLDHADHGHREVVLERLEACSRGAVARDDYEPGAAIDEQLADLQRVLQDLVARLRPVREPAGVAEVHDGLVREQVDERAQHRQTAEAGVEHADRTRVHGHGALPAAARASRSATAAPTPSCRWRDREQHVESAPVGVAKPRVDHPRVVVDVVRWWQRHESCGQRRRADRGRAGRPSRPRRALAAARARPPRRRSTTTTRARGA